VPEDPLVAVAVLGLDEEDADGALEDIPLEVSLESLEQDEPLDEETA